MQVSINGNAIEVLMTLNEWQEEYARASRGAASTIDPEVEKRLRSLGLPADQWSVEGVAYPVQTAGGERMRMSGKVKS
jgi:hypothetical protein